MIKNIKKRIEKNRAHRLHRGAPVDTRARPAAPRPPRRDVQRSHVCARAARRAPRYYEESGRWRAAEKTPRAWAIGLRGRPGLRRTR